MLLKELIENAEKTLGSQKALSLAIGQAPSYIRGAKAGLNSLPTYACIQLAKIINVPEITVIAASELVTEKKAERRAIFAPFVGRAASLVIGAIVLLNMSPSPANAAQESADTDKYVYYVKSQTKRRRLKQWILKALQMGIPETLRSFLVTRINHMPT